MSESEKGRENLVIVGRIENEHIGDDTETRLEGANAKIKILEDHIIDQDELLCQFVIATRHIRVILDALPEDYRTKVSEGFSLVTQVENIKDILSRLDADSSD